MHPVAEGEVKQSAVFGEQLVLHRRVEATVGGTSLRIADEVENVGHERTSHMLLYHCNVGFPVVDEGSELLVPYRSVRTDPWSTVEGHERLTAPPRPSRKAASTTRRPRKGMAQCPSQWSTGVWGWGSTRPSRPGSCPRSGSGG